MECGLCAKGDHTPQEADCSCAHVSERDLSLPGLGQGGGSLKSAKWQH